MWGNSRVIGIPVFMDTKNLQVFIDEDLRHGSKKWNTETNVDLCELIQFQTAKEKPAHGGLKKDKSMKTGVYYT